MKNKKIKHLLILISFLLLSSPVIGQSEKPQTIIIPTGSLGEISEIRKKMLEKTLESKLDDYFAIVPKELFEEAQEQAFQEMDSDECTEDQCILMIKEILQIENAFKMDLMYEEGDTQISITWNDQDQKRVEEDYCEGCKTKELRLMIGGLVEKLVGVKEIKPVVVVEKKSLLETNKDTQTTNTSNNNILYRKIENGKWVWANDGNKKLHNTYKGELKNNLPEGYGVELNIGGGKVYEGNWKGGEKHGEGTETIGKEKVQGEWKNGERWNVNRYFGSSFSYKIKNGKRE